jgi:hypothetical protein
MNETEETIAKNTQKGKEKAVMRPPRLSVQTPASRSLKTTGQVHLWAAAD